MKSLPNDISRCNRHSCRLKNECLRYLQVPMDFHDDRNNKLPITKFEGTIRDQFEFVIECDDLIKIEENDL